MFDLNSWFFVCIFYWCYFNFVVFCILVLSINNITLYLFFLFFLTNKLFDLWQMIETKCFEELNVFGPNNTPSNDLRLDLPPPEDSKSCFPFRRRVRATCGLGHLSNLFWFAFFYSVHFCEYIAICIM